jgi:hypothetical protein
MVFGLLCGYFLSSAQISIDDIQFDKTFIDFGTIEVEDGIVIAKYKFTNNGTETFIISGVEAACGCTNAKASEYQVDPGESAVISAEFNPAGMIGTTTKWVYVRGNLDDAAQIDLKFKAKMKSVKLRDGDSYYPGEYGYLVFQRLHFEFGPQFVGEILQDSVAMFNDGSKDITISEISDLPSFLTLKTSLPLTIPSKTQGIFKVELNSNEADTIGPYVGAMKLITTDQYYAKKELTYAIDFYTNFKNWKRKELRKAAKITVDQQYVQLGEIKSGAKKSAYVTFKNEGKSDLIIKRIKTDCNCAVLSQFNQTIKPGQSIEVLAEFDSLYKSGKQSRAITLFTNDPQNPRFNIYLVASVQ